MTSRSTTALRTAWDVAALEPVGTAVAALDGDGAGRRRATGTSSTRWCCPVRRRWGVAKARRAFELVDARAESPPESRVRVALVLAGLSPVPQFGRASTGGEWLGRVDLAFPEAKIAIEYEGAYHFEDGQIVRDDARYARLASGRLDASSGVSAADLRDLDTVVARVRAALPGAEMAITALTPRAAETTARASSCTCARCSGPRKDSA